MKNKGIILIFAVSIIFAKSFNLSSADNTKLSIDLSSESIEESLNNIRNSEYFQITSTFYQLEENKSIDITYEVGFKRVEKNIILALPTRLSSLI